jgi:hypothetical protein
VTTLHRAIRACAGALALLASPAGAQAGKGLPQHGRPG